MKMFKLVILAWLAGASLGFLIGLSISPVLTIVITALMTGIGSFLAIMLGSKGSSDSVTNTGLRQELFQVKLAPFAFLYFGIAIGACIGTKTRTNDYLGINPDGFANKWKNTGLSSAEIQKAIFANIYGNIAWTTVNKNDSIKKNLNEYIRTTGLFAMSVKDCDMLVLLHGKKLESNLRLMNNAGLNVLLDKINSDSSCLESIKHIICQN